jgi:hypothetical protein
MPPKKPRNTGLLVGVIIAVVVVLAGLGVGGYFLFGHKSNSSNTAAGGFSPSGSAGSGGSGSGSGGSGSGGSGSGGATATSAQSLATAALNAVNAHSPDGFNQLLCTDANVKTNQAPSKETMDNDQLKVTPENLQVNGNNATATFQENGLDTNGQPATVQGTLTLQNNGGSWCIEKVVG